MQRSLEHPLYQCFNKYFLCLHFCQQNLGTCNASDWLEVLIKESIDTEKMKANENMDLRSLRAGFACEQIKT
jgi:hypothetical protein